MTVRPTEINAPRRSVNGEKTTSSLVISIILNTNRRKDTLECLASLRENQYQNHRSMVLDNGSTDGSIEAIRTAFPEVEIVSLTENLGYAGNNNVGIAQAVAQGADWIFVLNEDTTLAPDCITLLIETGQTDPRIGILGPMVYHHNEPTVIQSAGGRLTDSWDSLHIAMNEEDHGQLSTTRAVDWISGCGILVRRQVIEQVGMIDPRYFYFWEETEWCMRAQQAGWRILHVAGAKMWHKGVQRNYHPKPAVTYYATRNRLLTMYKHNAPVRVKLAVWIQIAKTLTSWTIRPKWRSMHGHRKAMRRGVTDFLRSRWGGPVEL